eukprot:9195220-Pyramimonas_sp.AAC.1
MNFNKVWYEAIFAETWVRAFLAAGKENSSGEDLLRCASALLDEFELGIPWDKLPAWASAAVNVCKAVVALISPIPGLYGAKLTDV